MSNLEIDLICPLCNQEIEEDDEIYLGQKTNIDKIDFEKMDKKVLIHVSCYEKKQNEKSSNDE